jgi:hypothetical protein
MSVQRIRQISLGLLSAALLALAPLGSLADAVGAQESLPAPEMNEKTVQQQLSKQFAERRQAMLQEAHAALDETNAALAALDDGKSQEALDALARATGKLELLLARDPDLALAPVNVEFVTHDLYATPKTIRLARDQAAEFLEEGRVQEARSLLSGLASEVVISVTNLPLATYPDAIKAISPLIDNGEIEKAKTALNAALSTLVVTNQVVSLPVLRARAALDAAESLVSGESPSDGDKQRVDELVKGAREQLEIAELLGYGNEAAHKEYRQQIAELERKISNEKETSGVFAKLRHSLDAFQTEFFE